MKKISLLVISVLLLFSCNSQMRNMQNKKEINMEVQEAVINYKTYHNERFDYSVDYPDFLIPQGEAGNKDGQKFFSEDREVKMSVYRAFRMNMVTGDMLSIQEALEKDANNLNVRDKKMENNFYILSGITEGNTYFSQYTMLINNEYYTIFFEYEYEYQQHQLTEVFEYVVESFSKQ